jgi:hypothetical protein
MSKATDDGDGSTDPQSTDVYDDGVEVAVRARSKNSRSTHVPKTDDDGTIVFVDGDDHTERVDRDADNAQPLPECEFRSGDPDAVDFVLKPVGTCTTRDGCKYCHGTNADPATGAGNLSPARRLRYGDDWGND